MYRLFKQYIYVICDFKSEYKYNKYEFISFYISIYYV